VLVTLILGSSMGACEQPKTVQPPLSARQEAWWAVLHPEQVTGGSSVSAGSNGERQ
jgi:hypothetical protein